MSQVQSST